MIRLEVALKDRYGYNSPSLEAELKRCILTALVLFANEQRADINRIQFLGPKKP